MKNEIFLQKYFGGLKKRRIFALAFKETSIVEKTATERKQREL